MSGILLGLGQLAQPTALLALLGGVVIGLIVGSLPGLNDSITMAVLIPITFGMEPQVAICLLVGIYCASACGGSVPSILLKIPGTASATVTAYDGYPMSQQGKSGQALGLAISSSTFGGLTSAIVLLFLSPFLAKQALKFGPPEYFMLAVLGMSTVIGMAGNNIAKNILAMAVGLIFSCIGMSPQTGLARFTFGQVSLMDGISLIPMLIGLFGITSILEMIEGIQKTPKVKEVKQKVENFKEDVKENYKKVKVVLPDKEMAKRLLPIWVQSSVIGNVIGIIPGAGMIMAIFMAYDQASRRRPNLEFGTGVPEGIAAPEAANNAVVASSMVPLLSLGVPGNSTSSLFLGALTIQGLRTGPTLFRDTPEMAYMIILGFIVANIIMLPLSVYYCNFLATAVLRLNRMILSGIVLTLCVTGAFAVSNNVFNIYVMVFFGFIGYTFNKYKIPQSPLILASILGSMMENNWTQSMKFADGSLAVFVTRPLSCALLILSIIFIGMPLVKRINANKAAKAA